MKPVPRLRKKAALELSVSFIVIIIISLVVFAGSIVILRNIFSGANEIKTAIDQQTDQDIRDLLASGEIVAVPISQKIIQIGNQDIFWIAISNALLDNKNFYTVVGFSNAYDLTGQTLLTGPEPNTINLQWLRYDSGAQPIKPGSYLALPILVSVKSSAGPGISTQFGLYAFNVCIFTHQPLPNEITTCGSAPQTMLAALYQPPKRFTVEVRG